MPNFRTPKLTNVKLRPNQVFLHKFWNRLICSISHYSLILATMVFPHAQSINLARRLSSKNEHDMLRKFIVICKYRIPLVISHHISIRFDRGIVHGW